MYLGPNSDRDQNHDNLSIAIGFSVFSYENKALFNITYWIMLLTDTVETLEPIKTLCQPCCFYCCSRFPDIGPPVPYKRRSKDGYTTAYEIPVFCL